MIDKQKVAALIKALLAELGEDVDRPGLQETPERVARWWAEFLEYDPGTIDTTFHEDNLITYSNTNFVLVSGIRVWSLCEHHLLPFWCDVTIGYKPVGKVLGLSKFARIAHLVAHKLQIQERLSNEIADIMQRVTDSPDVVVHARGEHLCMTMRGIKTPATTTTIVGRGVFETNPTELERFLLLGQLSR